MTWVLFVRRRSLARRLGPLSVFLLAGFALALVSFPAEKSTKASAPRYEYRRWRGFSDDGVVRFPEWTNVLALRAVADGATLVQLGRLDPGGAVVDSAVARMHADGTLDSAFAAGGPTPGVLQLGGPSTTIFVQRDGRFLINATRYLPDGTLDIAAPGLAPAGAGEVAFLETASGQLVTAQHVDVGGYRCQLSHHATNGVPGVTIGLDAGCTAAVAVPNGDGTIVMTQHSTDGLRLVFLTADGRLDTSKGGGTGVVAVDPLLSAQDPVVGAVRWSDEILLAMAAAGGSDETVVARIGLDGKVDGSFGTKGITVLAGAPLSLHADADADTITVHIRSTFAIRQGSPYHPTIVALRPDGALNTQFNPNGPTPGWWDAVEVGFPEFVLDGAHLDLARGRVMLGFGDYVRPGQGVTLVVVEPTGVQLAVITVPANPLRPATRISPPTEP